MCSHTFSGFISYSIEPEINSIQLHDSSYLGPLKSYVIFHLQNTFNFLKAVMLGLEAKKPGLGLVGLGLVGSCLGLVGLDLGLVKYGLKASRGQEASSPSIKCKVEKSYD